MGTIKYLIIPIVFIGLSASMKQPDVNYKHKTLFKELHKAGIEQADVLREIDANANTVAKNQGKFFKITAANNKQYTYVYIGRVNSCRSGGCGAGSSGQGSFNSEYFDYFIIYDQNKAVRLVRVFNYQATHGQEVTARGWLKQFTGYTGEKKLEVNKDVDGISGATVSVYAITADVTAKTEILKSLDI